MYYVESTYVIWNHNGRAGCSSEFIHQVSEVSLFHQPTHVFQLFSSSFASLLDGEHDSFREKSDLEGRLRSGVLAPVGTTCSGRLEGNQLQRCRSSGSF